MSARGCWTVILPGCTRLQASTLRLGAAAKAVLVVVEDSYGFSGHGFAAKQRDGHIQTYYQKVSDQEHPTVLILVGASIL